MASNTFGNTFRLTSFGESHGPAIGGIIDGCPAGIPFDMELVRGELRRRRPGQSEITTTRNESDEVEILSGVFEGLTTGTPIGFVIRNSGAKSKDYDQLKDTFRPGHADHSWQEKFGVRDHRGGGRASARETASRIVGGAVATMLLKELSDIRIGAYVSSIHKLTMPQSGMFFERNIVDSNMVRCPDEHLAQKMIAAIEEAREQQNSLGGVITCVVTGMPSGLGEPVFDKLPALLAHAMMSLPATKGFEMGDGFRTTQMMGSESNDAWNSDGHFSSNHAGGSSGGISNGQDLVFNIAFKPASSIARPQQAITSGGEVRELRIDGRHDPCVVPRAVPIVEAMCALVLADLMLRKQNNRIRV